MASDSWLQIRRKARSIDQETRKERIACIEQDLAGGQGMDCRESWQGTKGRDGCWISKTIPR